jgi:hypothetical protein
MQGTSPVITVTWEGWESKKLTLLVRRRLTTNQDLGVYVCTCMRVMNAQTHTYVTGINTHTHTHTQVHEPIVVRLRNEGEFSGEWCADLPMVFLDGHSRSQKRLIRHLMKEKAQEY